jgi:hypothetical protein
MDCLVRAGCIREAFFQHADPRDRTPCAVTAAELYAGVSFHCHVFWVVDKPRAWGRGSREGWPHYEVRSCDLPCVWGTNTVTPCAYGDKLGLKAALRDFRSAAEATLTGFMAQCRVAWRPGASGPCRTPAAILSEDMTPACQYRAAQHLGDVSVQVFGGRKQ